MSIRTLSETVTQYKPASLWCGDKLYLSFSDQTGWSIQKLNFFEQLARNLFGCYKETHSAHIFTHKYDHLGETKDLDQKIQTIWKKNVFEILAQTTLKLLENHAIYDIELHDQINIVHQNSDKDKKNAHLLISLMAQRALHKIAPDKHYTLRNRARLVEMELRGSNPFISILTEKQKEVLCDFNSPIFEPQNCIWDKDHKSTYLGHGRFGGVTKEMIQGQPFAVKLGNVAQDFQMGKNLKNKNIVEVYFMIQNKFGSMLFMQFVNGITLKDYKTKNNEIVPPSIQTQISQACGYLETLNLKHHDFHDNNVMISNEHPYIIDLGGIKSLWYQDDYDSSSYSSYKSQEYDNYHYQLSKLQPISFQ